MSFDGMDDYVDTPFILNPGKDSLSVFAWIYCWTPGQVIISHRNTTSGRAAIPGSTKNADAEYKRIEVATEPTIARGHFVLNIW